MAWLAQGNPAADVPFFRTTVPATGKGVYVPNVVKRLGMTGLGTLVVVAVGSAGTVDRNALIGGSCRICSYSGDRLPLCESIAGIRPDLFGEHAAARAEGLRCDSTFRTNVGIANLDGEGRRFTVTALGERHSEVFEVFVPPFALIHTAVPRHDYGTLTLEVTASGSRAPWVFYGSSVNNASGATSTFVGVPRP